MLLRNVVTGQKFWYDSCYYNGKMEKNEIILWQSPVDDKKERYKLVAWKWQGFDKKPSRFNAEIDRFACNALLELDLPLSWEIELKDYMNRHHKVPS